MSKKIPFLLALTAASALSMGQTVALNHEKTGSGQAGSNWYRNWGIASGGSLLSNVSASATGGVTTSSSVSMTIRLTITVKINGTPDLHPSATLGYSFGRSRSASAIASNHVTGGSANGVGTIDTLTKSASVGVGDSFPPAAIDSNTISGTATIPTADFTYAGGVWTGTYEININNLSASGFLNHPEIHWKDDEGTGASSLATSNFLPSNVVVTLN